MLKFALPKGRLLPATAAWLDKVGWGLADYLPSSRSYRPRPAALDQVAVKVFQERDIPIQVAIGNYDLGICGSDWVAELTAKYPLSPVIKVKDLGYGRGYLYLAGSAQSHFTSLPTLKRNGTDLRIVGEYPNLAEAMALKLRLRHFRIFPLWGAAEAYPPEDADLVLVRTDSAAALAGQGLVPLYLIAPTDACLIAHHNSWQERDMGAVLSPLLECNPPDEDPTPPAAAEITGPWSAPDPDTLRLALPDGHQQEPTAQLLRRAGLKTEGYTSGERRPDLGWAGVAAKVIRPQDMPQQVACGHFDLAITGRDWYLDHLYGFPDSPVELLLDLGLGRVRMVAVVAGALPVANGAELRTLLATRRFPYLRVASEYVRIADKYARDHHLSPYRVIPTWGATEAFLPEDADLLIENTQTGQTLARHGLKIIDTLFESTAYLIGRKGLPPEKRGLVAELVGQLCQGRG